jgi:tRNA-dihydrouridine synthase B
MEGVTDLPFRRFIRELSKDKPPLFVSEFLSTGSSLFLTPVNTRAVRFDKEEEPFCMQLFGHNAERLSAAALQAQELGASFVELNAGCPAPKIANKGSGSGLLRDLPNLQKILESIKSVLKVPLFLKSRLGWDENSIVIDDVLEIAEGCGVEQLTLHGRTKVQGYKGFANWNAIGEIAAKAKIPIIGNGDIDSIEKALNAINLYGVKGVAIGRAVLRNPWIFAGTKKITPSDACNAILRYEKLLRADSLREGQIIGRLKQLSARLCLEFSPDFRLKVLHSRSVQEILDNWIANEPACYQ